MSRTPHFDRILRRTGPMIGEHVVPGDKSISHRAALLGGLATGITTIEGFASSADCAATLRCLDRLGVRVERRDSTVVIHGEGREGLRAPTEHLDVANSGTTARLLLGILAGCAFEATVTGDESIRQRPMERVARPLRQMGADVETVGGLPPVRVRGRALLSSTSFRPETPSAQVKSAVLLAGLAAEGRTTVLEQVLTRDHSERMLVAFGAQCGTDSDGVWIEGPQELRATDVTVPGDISSAVFLISLALLVPGSNVTIKRVGLNPTRTRILDILADLGAPIEVSAVATAGGEPYGDIRVGYVERLGSQGGRRFELTPTLVAEVIDEVPILAVLATRVAGGIRFTGAGDLRRKESDRIETVAEGLRRMGARVDVWADGFAVEGPVALHGAEIRSHGDHRVAMAFSCAALAAEGESRILAADAVDVSFPEFYEHLPRGAVIDGA